MPVNSFSIGSIVVILTHCLRGLSSTQNQNEYVELLLKDREPQLNLGIAKGTSSFGKRHNKTHTLCRRCGELIESFVILKLL